MFSWNDAIPYFLNYSYFWVLPSLGTLLRTCGLSNIYNGGLHQTKVNLTAKWVVCGCVDTLIFEINVSGAPEIRVCLRGICFRAGLKKDNIASTTVWPKPCPFLHVMPKEKVQTFKHIVIVAILTSFFGGGERLLFTFRKLAFYLHIHLELEEMMKTRSSCQSLAKCKAESKWKMLLSRIWHKLCLKRKLFRITVLKF